MSVAQLHGSGSSRAARIQGLGSAVCQVFRRIVLGAPSRARRDSLLLDAAVEIRSGSPDEALKRLRPYLNVLTRDPVFLNMMGAAHEATGRSDFAHELYRIALISDPQYGPAQRNLHRLEDWDGDSSTRRPAALGDVELRAHRTVNIAKAELPKVAAPEPVSARASSSSAPAPTRFVIITRRT